MKGLKYDKNKPRLDLIPPESIIGLGEVMTYGAEKYSPGDWKNVSIDRYEAALLRHLMAWKQGEELDPETGLNHLKHVLANAAIMVALNNKYPFNEGDDYWVIEVGQIIWSCWDEESEEMHDENPDRTYYTTKQQAINAYIKQIINNNGINN